MPSIYGGLLFSVHYVTISLSFSILKCLRVGLPRRFEYCVSRLHADLPVLVLIDLTACAARISDCIKSSLQWSSILQTTHTAAVSADRDGLEAAFSPG